MGLGTALTCAGVLMRNIIERDWDEERSRLETMVFVGYIYNTRRAFLWPGFQTATGIVVFVLQTPSRKNISRRRFRLRYTLCSAIGKQHGSFPGHTFESAASTTTTGNIFI